ncbi:MAG: hypothetical protein DMF84_30765 [Acidobacteria bacterium]|nr:MAG: hypothetical protein DMF84_30765 [Acidobacteriota bacterium]
MGRLLLILAAVIAIPVLVIQCSSGFGWAQHARPGAQTVSFVRVGMRPRLIRVLLADPHVRREVVNPDGACQVVRHRVRHPTSDSVGQYCVNGLTAGRFTLRATKSGYDIAERDVTVSGNVTADIPMHRQSSPSPAPTPTPSPTPPTPHPGPNGPACDASSIPGNATCIGNGTPPVTAVCEDGAFSCSQNRSGTCSSHQGVKCWVCPGLLCNGLTIFQSKQNFTPAFGGFSSVNGGGR